MIDGFSHEPPARRRALQLLTWTWCLPTTLVGLVAGVLTVALLGGRATPYRGATVVRSPRLRSLGGVCLGPVILVTDRADAELVAHEWGHFRQHLHLGPLYLLVIGLPSATHAIWHRLRGGGFPDYFHFWTEAWADDLAGIYPRHAHLHPRWTSYALGPFVAAVATLLTLRAFGPALAFPFTDTDALADVAWAGHPFADQLLVPLTGGVAGDNANFWRPAAMLQFWALRRAFGEVPAGWHAWSLFLHVACSVLVGLLVEALTTACGRADRRVAAFAAVLFAAHPLAEEVVPATARSLDLLLGVGFCGALLALLRACDRGQARHPVATALFFASAVLAIGAKEAGVLLLPVAAAWIALFGDRRVATRILPPLAALVGAYVVVRAGVLHGLGGYHSEETLAEPGLLGHALARAFLEPLLPSLSPQLHPFEGLPGIALTVGIWALLLAALRRHRRLLAALAAVYLPWIVLLGVTGTYSRRVLYVATFAIVTVLALAAVELSRRPRVALASVVVPLLAAWLHGSPAIVRYDDWDVVARSTEALLDPALWARFPDGAAVWLVDRPTRLDRDPRRFRLWSSRGSLANAAATYSLQAWLDEHVGRGLRLRSLSSTVLVGDPEAYAAEVVAEGAEVRVARPPVERALHAPANVSVTEDGADLRVAASKGKIRLVVWDARSPTAVELAADASAAGER